MSTCPDVGRWRSWLDGVPDAAPGPPGQPPAEPARLGVAPTKVRPDGAAPDSVPDLPSHLAACPGCRAVVDDLRASAAVTVSALDRLAPATPPAPAAVALARQRLAWAQRRATPAASAPAPGEAAAISLSLGQPAAAALTPTPLGTQRSALSTHYQALSTRLRRWRAAAAGVAAALALVLLVGTPQGRTATAQFLAQFRSQRFAVVAIEPGRDRGYLAYLDHLGSVQGSFRARHGETVASVAEASQRVGFRVQQPDPAALPAGLGPTPSVEVWPATEYRFTFDRPKAQAYFRASGHPEVDLPERFDGASLVVAVPAAAFLEYTAPDNTQMLVVGQAHELEVGVEGGVTLDELREFLLSLPDLPPDTVRQLRAIEDWRTTLPIPVPVDQVAWQHVTIAGGPGLLLADNTGVGSGALWQRDDRVYGVAGTARAPEIQRVADSLR